MIFAIAIKEPTVFVMLCEADIVNLQADHYKFVDKRMTKGAKFDKIILSLHKTDEESIKMLQLGNKLYHNPGIKSTCKGCKGDIKTELLFEDKCIVCWAKEAKAQQIEVEPDCK